MPDQPETPTFDEWAIVEMMGHRRLAGRIREVQIAGAGFLRLDIPAASDTDPARTQFIAPGSVYAIHPVEPDTALRAAANWRPEPVSRWELPAAPEPDPITAEDYAQHFPGDDDDA